MTIREAGELYTWIAGNWPTVIWPNASDAARRDTIRAIYEAYKDLKFSEVIQAWERWTNNNDRYPTRYQILNEIAWLRQEQRGQANEERYSMDYLDRDGNEWSLGSFTRSVFVNHPRNKHHLQPEEWHRRFMATRSRWHKERGLLGELSAEQQDYFARKIAEAQR